MPTAPSDAPRTLSVSIVSYGGDIEYLPATIDALAAAAEAAEDARVEPLLVDNGPADALRSARLQQLLSRWPGDARLIGGHGNVGYGRGHNLALAQVDSDFHLVLNPDVELAPDALREAIRFLDDHPDCGLLAPAVRGDDGELQYLCKRFPSLLDFALRGFAPGFVRRWFHRRLAHYEMRDLINDRDVVWDPPIVSGCFMLFRTSLLKALDGFDPRFFLYFEDFDLSLRAGAHARLAYVPTVSIVHHGGGASRKGLAHLRMFLGSAVRFFGKHGWRWF